MAKRALARGVKLHRSYTVDEAARATGSAKGTVRRWIKSGLPALTDQKPLLILGSDLIDYLNVRRTAKRSCRLHECFCFSCREPRAPAFGEVEMYPLTPSSGNMRALCEVCGQVMHKRVSTGRFPDLKALVAVMIMQGANDLGDNHNPCPNDHQPREG